MFSKKATKMDEIFTVDLTLCGKCQIYGEDFVNFRGLLIKYELYLNTYLLKVSKFQNESMKSSFLPKYESNIVRFSPLHCATLTWQEFLQFVVHILGETMNS